MPQTGATLTFNQGRWVYCLLKCEIKGVCTIQARQMDKGYSPPPTQFPSSVKQMTKTLDNTWIGVSQQLVNSDSTIIQHPELVGEPQNGHKLCQEANTAHHKISQHPSGEKGEREGFKSASPNSVL